MFESEIFAIMENKIDEVIEQRKSLEQNMSAIDIKAEIEKAVNLAATRFKNIKGNIALLPVHGFISHRATIWAALGFEASSELLGMWFDAAIADNSIGAVVLDINSPGGTVFGLTAIGDKIFNARGTKPIIAVSNSLMASAAFWIGSAADEIIADPDSLTGSVGSVMVHVEQVKLLDEMGVKATVIRSAEHKFEGNDVEVLSDEARTHFQSQIDSFGDSFIAAVARNRDTTAANVRANFGQGRVMRAEQARSAGMVDRIATLENVIRRLQSTSSASNNSRARATVQTAKAKGKMHNMNT